MRGRPEARGGRGLHAHDHHLGEQPPSKPAEEACRGSRNANRRGSIAGSPDGGASSACGRPSPPGRLRFPVAPKDGHSGPADVEGPGVARSDDDRRPRAGARGGRRGGDRPGVRLDADWYWAISAPRRPVRLHQPRLFTVGTLGEALAASVTAIGLVLAPLAVLMARMRDRARLAGCECAHAAVRSRAPPAPATMWSAMRAASSPTPPRKCDLRVRWNLSPSANSPGAGRHAFPVHQLAVGVEDRDLEPRVGAPVAGRP